MLHGSERETLTAALEHPRFWTAVHAAEYLIELETAPEAVDGFVARLSADEAVPVRRIGVWRVKALRARGRNDWAGFDRYTSLLKNVAFADRTCSDRVHALETLFKLDCRCSAAEREMLKKFRSGEQDSPGMQVYAAALLALSDQSALRELTGLFERYRSDRVYCGVLLYVCKRFPALPDDLLALLDDMRKDTAAAPEHRIAAAGILLRHRKIPADSVAEIPEKVCPAYLQILQEYAPQSRECKKILRQMKESDNMEMKLYAAYIILKSAPPSDEKRKKHATFDLH